MIKLQNINVIFNKNTQLQKHVLKDVNLQIIEGQFVTLIGGNGAGKSTLANVLAGNIKPSSGQIWLDDIEVTGKPDYRRASDIAKVSQDPLLGTFADLTIEENMALAYSRGKNKSLRLAINGDLKDKFKTALEELGIGLENRIEDKVSSLSGGQRQALSLVMSSLQNSKLLLLDEHTAALDPKMAKLILKITNDVIKKHNLTTLMITHSMTQALEYGDRTIMMQHGEIVKDLYGNERQQLSVTDLLEFFEA